MYEFRREGEMTAYRWYPGAKTLTKAQVPVPKPAGDEVLVKILAAGMCHSDLLYYDDAFKHNRTNPFTMGHEGAGELIALGESVPSTFPGLHMNQYIVIHARNPCLSSSCSVCSIGADNICDRYFPCGLGIDGSYAPYMVAPARDIVPVNASKDEIPPPLAAVSTDAVLTSYHALMDLKAGETILLIGIGGLGINAIQIAKNVKGAKTVIAVDTRDVMLQAALEVGADYAVNPEELGSLLSSNNLTIDTACDFVGIDHTFISVLQHIRPQGTIIIVGLGAISVELPLIPAARKEVTIKTTMWGTKKELAEVLTAVKERKILPIIERRPLVQAVETLEDMRNGRLKGRVVFVLE
ncbi:alcohol dehydogenase [Lentinula aciculospora]|uniref:Alcohol dehydogenase n=1 Tax=Lentinula aciculospora TaxID=153920 RepID=A0A9W9DE47_9AGAR|nr:alcohol dehydogenase [Lentinula aciculospora]